MDYAALLRAKRAEILAAIGRRDRIAVERYADPLDQVWQLTAREVSAGELSRLTEQLAEIDAALARLRAGTYGVCLDCGDPIQPRRLEAVPWASRCRDCQEAFDRELAAQDAVVLQGVGI